MAAVGGRPTRWWLCCSPDPCLQVAAAVLLLSTLNIAGGRDTLGRGESIRGEQTLVSAGGIFELGLFSPPGSSHCYVGTWYKNITGRTVVWVANRETPTSDCSGALAVDALGSVMILDGSSNLVKVLGDVHGSDQVILQDSGNLVVRAAGSDKVAWQSFDYPTDTWLPDMVLGKRQNLTSWRSPADPSPGDFTLIADSGTATRRGRLSVIKTQMQMQMDIRLWDMTSNPWYAYDVIRNFTYYATAYDTPEEEYYFVYAAASPFTRVVMAVQGQLQLQTWTSRNWTVLWTSPRQIPKCQDAAYCMARRGKQKCEDAAYCGANGICNSGGSPTCKCLPGFDPSSPDSWEKGNWSDGCSRRHPTKCAGDEFPRLQGVGQPFVEPYNHVSNSSAGCEERCAANCSCTAYALGYRLITLAGCAMWFGELMGFQEDYPGGVDLYIRRAASNSTNPNTSTSSGEIAKPPQGPGGSPDLPSGEPAKVSGGGAARKWPLKFQLSLWWF